MPLKRFPQNDHHSLRNSYQEALNRGEFTSIPEIAAQPSMNYTAPKAIPPRKGRILAALIAGGVLIYGGYNVWNTYLRYDAFGIVDSDKVNVYSSNPGFITSLTVVEGDQVSQGDVVGSVTSSEDRRSLEKVEDEIRVAQADLAAKKVEMEWATATRSDNAYQIKGLIAVEEGTLRELRTRYAFYRSEVNRLNRLKKMGAASPQELDTAISQLRSTEAQISSKTSSLLVLRERDKTGQSSMTISVTDQIAPLEKKLAYLLNDKKRIEEKIAEGQIVSPVSGVVSAIEKRRGEKVGDEPIFTVIVDNTSNLVLYYDPADRIPDVGTKVEVMSPSLGKMVKTRVAAISKDVVTPPDQIKRNYMIDQKLVKVFLTPETTSMDTFVVGSVVKKPNPQDIMMNAIRVVKTLEPSEAYADSKH